jgi:hypothetical protein
VDNWLNQKAKEVAKGPLNFGALPDVSWNRGGSGVNYLSSTAGSQVFSANALVSR